MDTMNSERFMDQTPRQIYAELLDEDKYLASVSTMYRLLLRTGQSNERRNQRPAQHAAIPRLVATRANEVWTWDISKIATFTPGVFFNLYLVLDLWSRYPVAWMVAERENSALSKQLISTAVSRHQIVPATLTLHNDRGSPMTSNTFTKLLEELEITCSKSRPRVSNDNPFSEAAFKTIKYQPDYPGRFQDIEQAQAWFRRFFDWYANEHRHSELALFTPSDVFFGRVEDKVTQRQKALDEAHRSTPERFVRGVPQAKRPPARVYINRVRELPSSNPWAPSPEATLQGVVVGEGASC